MFEVDGEVTEVGFDHLAHVRRSNAIIGAQSRVDVQPSTSANSANLMSSSRSSSTIFGAMNGNGADEAHDLHYSEESDNDDSPVSTIVSADASSGGITFDSFGSDDSDPSKHIKSIWCLSHAIKFVHTIQTKFQWF